MMPTIHIGHSHGKRHKSKKTIRREMREDIAVNGCMRLYHRYKRLNQ